MEKVCGSTHKGRRGYARFRTQNKGALQNVALVRPHMPPPVACEQNGVLIMPTQKFMRVMLEIENVFDPTGPFTNFIMRATHFIGIFLENGIYDESITEALLALDVYESFPVLEALPTRWSPTHLFKCNCRTCSTHASCAHVLLASLVCDHKIEIPCLQDASTTFQVRRKRGRPAVSGQNAEVGDVEEEKRKKVHDEGGDEVPPVTLRVEPVDSNEDFEQPPPSQAAFA